uniref:Lipoprotein n=1 Tax=Candidatus Kentrum sp. SD TaxID=2126332 RepID=A0A451BJA1_9GAMM|nr:MAG: hypothetical protein BECKSD772D_GA0070982_101324 [Candidatus Kentron sp. SD]
MIRIATILGAAALLTGCAAISELPVIENEMATNTFISVGEQEIGTLAITAQRRLIIANMKTGHFCSEPPPEAADSIATALTAALQANAERNGAPNAEFARNFATHVSRLYKRSHTVQLFRDTSFQLCVNALNEASETNGMNQQSNYRSYRDAVMEIVKALSSVLEQEIKAYYEVEKEKAKNPVPPIQTGTRTESGMIK